MNIRARFGLATTLIAVLVICLAAFGVHALRATNGLIIRIYEQPLMGVSYGRAATTTFAEARAAVIQGRLLGPSASVAVAAALGQMEMDIAGDLRIVRERIQDPGVTGVLDRAEAAITEWFRSERTVLSPPAEGLTALPMPTTIERQSAAASRLLDDLVEFITANGFAYREHAQAEMRNSNANLGELAATTIGLSTFFVVMFGRMIVRPVLEATRIAEAVASGNVTAIHTSNRQDEIGRLMTCLATMQASLLSRYAQTRALLTEKDRTAETLRHMNQRFDTAINNMTHGLLMCDREGRVVVINRRFCEIYNIALASVPAETSYRSVCALCAAAGNHPGQTHNDIVADIARAAQSSLRSPAFRTFVGGRTIAISYEPTPDGGWLAMHEDITERQQAEASIEFMARHDALTKLPNRAMFRERIEQAISMAGRGTGFAVICLDLDHFKQVNDTLGHPIGDGLLVAVAERLQACVREGDTVARLGGDEFVIIQYALRHRDDAKILATRISAAFRQPFNVSGRNVTMGVSIGVAVAPEDGVSHDTLMRHADLALYLAKAEGRGIVRFFEPEMDSRIRQRRLLEMDLHGAIARNEFELHYQPLVNLVTNKVVAFEALLRWHHPVRGNVSPLDFIPVAEESGIIVAIGEWVLQTACFEAENWPSHIGVAVNLSPIQFKKGDLVATVRSALAASGLRANRLELEITESIFLRDTADTLSALRHLRKMGIGVALDDFGTGYSSLSYLRSFPFSKIKIDQSFVRDLLTNKESVSIVRAVIGLGKSLGIKTIAEGVETQEQLDRLRNEGCVEVQGYFFSPPRPASELPLLIATIQRAHVNAPAEQANF